MPVTLSQTTESTPTWIVMPVLGARDYTIAAIADCFAQSVAIRLLVVNQGVDDAFRTELEDLAADSPIIHLWNHVPPLPSLAATWNRALDFVWACGGTEALVVNNDVRLHRSTVEYLRAVLHEAAALFVTAVGVLPEQFNPTADYAREIHDYGKVDAGPRGGPDFSCFLISKDCHDQFRFDEHFIPAYCEDLDYHRRLMLAGEGQKIFSVNLPYLHYAAATRKGMSDQGRADLDRAIGLGSRVYYEKKWGGPVNQETYRAPFASGPYSAWLTAAILSQPAGNELTTTPELQRYVQEAS